jgi:hypothetical protein
MTRIFTALLLASALAGIGPANAADGCGIGCHATIRGACVVDGWEVGAATWNECPAVARPRPPCGEGYVWHKSLRACFLK